MDKASCEGYLKKKWVMVVWAPKNPQDRAAIVVPKLYKYIVRYFFIMGDLLCYTKTKKERDTHKHKVLVDLSYVAALHVSEPTLEIVDHTGNHFVLKGSNDDIHKWAPILAGKIMPKVESIRIPAPSSITPPPSLPRNAAAPPTSSMRASHHHPTNNSTTTTTATTPPSPTSQPVAIPLVSSPSFPIALNDNGDPPTPVLRASHMRKMPSFRTNSSLTFTLSTRQNPYRDVYNDEQNVNPQLLQSYSAGTPIQNLGWDDWEAIFTKYQQQP
jgi:hypothetical protein